MSNTQIGVTIEEQILSSINLGSSGGVRNIGYLMERVRGVANKPFTLTDPRADKKIFGGYDDNMYSPHVLENFWDNLGGYGATVVGVRIVGTGCVASSVVVKNEYEDLQTLVTETTQAASATLPQINTVTVGDTIDENDSFSMVMGTTTLTHVATAGQTEDDIATALLALIVAEQTANPLGDWSGVTWARVDNVLTGTANANNTPFTQTSSTTNAAGSDDIFTVKAARQGLEDVGTWGDDLAVKVYPKDDPNGVPNEYLFQVYYQNLLVETWQKSTWEALQAIVNEQSEYVLIEEIDFGIALDRGVFSSDLSGGVYVAPTTEQMEPSYNSITGDPQGLAIFEGLDVQILACPEIFDANFAATCSNWSLSVDKFFAFSMSYLATETTVQGYFNTLVTSLQSAAAGYLEWCLVKDRDGEKRWIPAIGYFLGAGYVRKAAMNNSRAWIPPAGVETRAVGILEFTHSNMTVADKSRYVTSYYCNNVKYVTNTGNVIASSRTYSSDPLFQSIHIRLETNWLKRNLLERNEKYVQKLNTPQLRSEMKVDNTAWMQNIYNQGGVEQSVDFKEAVVITVEQSAEDRKNVTMEVAWIPPETTEKIKIILGRNDGVLVLSEA